MTAEGQRPDAGPAGPSGSERLLAWLYVPVAAGLLVVLPGGHRLLLWPAAAALVAYLVQRVVRLPLADGYVSIVQPSFVLLLFAVPLNVVAILVPAGIFASAIVGYRSLGLQRMPLALADAWYCIPPILVLSLFAPGALTWHHWPVYLAAFAAELAVGLVGPVVRLGLYRRGLGVDLATLTLPAAIDLLLTPFGLAAAAAAPANPAGAVLLLASVLILIALLGHERSERLGFEQLALRDPLTGLANRALFDELLDATGRRLSRTGNRSALVFIDLDNFKQINDRHGHLAGDLVLRTIAARLQNTVRHGDTVARFGGDEFAVLLSDGATADAIDRVAGAITRAISEPISLPGVGAVTMTASIGTATVGAENEPLDAMAQADQAMYHAKHQTHSLAGAAGR